MRTLRSAVNAVLLLAACAGFAQTKPGDIVADIPFPFTVATQTLPAGHYVLSPADDSTLGIHDAKNQGVFVPTRYAQRSSQDNSCKLVFHRYGDEYFLAELWIGGRTTGRELYASRAERELVAKKIVKETNVIAAK
jgi:hypothetical protein